MEFAWEKHDSNTEHYTSWFQRLEEIRHSGTPLTVDQLFLLAKTAHKVDSKLQVFDWSLEQLKSIPLNEKRDLAYFNYLMALSERSFNRLEEAKDYAKQSCHLAENSAFYPIAQCLYALYLTETKKVHLGLEIFQEVLERPVPALAESSATSNLITFCIELGQTSALQNYYPKTTRASQLRCDIYRAILKDDHIFLEQVINNCPLDPKINHLSLHSIDLIIYGTLQNRPELLKQMNQGWIGEYLRPLAGDPLFKRALILLQENNCELLQVEKVQSWYAQLRIDFLDFLIAINRDEKKQAASILKDRISPLAEELRINNPLIPHLSYGQIVPDSPISAKISQFLNGVALKVSSEKVLVSQKGISYRSGDKFIELDLSKGLKSLTLLRVLSGKKGRATSKEQIHQALSDIPYHPLEHDSRIHKLLDRLQKKLVEEGFPELWYKPGDNNIILNCDIDLI